jgi:hypothetical protein
MEIVMDKGEIICIDGDARGLEISSFTGTLWITQIGDPNDYIISSGNRFKISQKGRVAVTACKTAKAHFSSSVRLLNRPDPWQVQLKIA